MYLILYSYNKIREKVIMTIIRKRKYHTILYFLEKKPAYKWNVQFKPMLFEGQLYYQNT